VVERFLGQTGTRDSALASALQLACALKQHQNNLLVEHFSLFLDGRRDERTLNFYLCGGL